MNSRAALIALIISATLNLIVAGALIGHFLRGGPEPRFPGHLGEVLENIDPDQQDKMKQQFRKFRQEGRGLHQEMRQQQRQLLKVILQDPFDEDLARAEFKKLRESGNAVQAHMHDQMLLAMKNLNQSDRAKLIRRVLRSGREGGPSRHRPDQDQENP